MGRSVSKGTPDQMINAFENRINELSSGDVNSNTSIEAAGYHVPYGYQDAKNYLNGKLEFYGNEIEMDFGDGMKLARYLQKKGEQVNYCPSDETWSIPGSCHWGNCYFYPYEANLDGYDDNGLWDGHSGPTSSTNASTQVVKASKNKNYAKGTPEQMISAFEGRIAELSGDVDACDAITAAYRDDVIEDDILGATKDEDPTYESRYIHTLTGDVNSQLTEYGQFETWTWDQNATEGTLILTTVVGEQVHEYSIPLDDLSGTFEGIESDVEYILSAVLQGGGAADEGLAEDPTGVESTTAIEAGLFEFGAEAAAQYGDLICERLAGKTVSKRRDLADAPGGLIYEANELGIDMWDLLEALEGLCRQRRCTEIDDSTYKVLGSEAADGIEDEEVVIEGEDDIVYENDDLDDEPTSEEWIEVESKNVPDADGFQTEYTLYRNADSTMFICMFGDREIYTPDLDYADFETEDEQEAYDWFYSYRGFEDEA